MKLSEKLKLIKKIDEKKTINDINDDDLVYISEILEELEEDQPEIIEEIKIFLDKFLEGIDPSCLDLRVLGITNELYGWFINTFNNRLDIICYLTAFVDGNEDFLGVSKYCIKNNNIIPKKYMMDTIYGHYDDFKEYYIENKDSDIDYKLVEKYLEQYT